MTAFTMVSPETTVSRIKKISNAVPTSQYLQMSAKFAMYHVLLQNFQALMSVFLYSYRWWMVLMMTSALSLHDVFSACIIHSFHLLSVEHLDLMRKEVFIVCTTHFLKLPIQSWLCLIIPARVDVHIVDQEENNMWIFYSYSLLILCWCSVCFHSS